MRTRRKRTTKESKRRRGAGRRADIHDDKEAARKAGFVAPIAGGEQTIAVMAKFLLDKFGMGFLRGGRIEVALVKPVFFGDTLTLHARIVSSIPMRIAPSCRFRSRISAASAC